MNNPHEDYYNKKNDERFLHFRASMIGIAILLVVAALLSVGYMNYKVMKGDWKFDSEQSIPKKKCSGYTVLDGDRVILCDGDTVKYDWHVRFKRLAK